MILSHRSTAATLRCSLIQFVRRKNENDTINVTEYITISRGQGKAKMEIKC